VLCAALAPSLEAPHALREGLAIAADFSERRGWYEACSPRIRRLIMATSAKREHTRREVDDLLRLRDEIKLQVHLAGMDAKSAWKKLEPRFFELEHDLAEEGEIISDATYALVRDLGKALQQFRSRI
jgi:hypothetical protein